jgi:2,4-dienoyl-CoA reductase-like NADH-dependent reductase (Old Yellow Enzyme family)
MSLFSPLTVKTITFKNRVVVSPMCQYSSQDGLVNDWHKVHLGSRAVGGAALVIMEATAVTPEGRISAGDVGLWSDHQTEPMKSITSFISSQGSVPGIQLAHAGRKAGTFIPWKGSGSVPLNDGGWETLGPSALAFDPTHAAPKAMTFGDIQKTIDAFVHATRRAVEAGFKVVEIHAAHGYLLHQFLSPLSNQRADNYGGSLENRMRFPLEIVQAIRKAWPDSLPLFIRISATDWVDGGWTLEESVEFCKKVKTLGVDVVDASSGGMVPYAQIKLSPGYQVPFAEKIKKEAGIHTMAVGMVTEPSQADALIREGKADLVALARVFLRDPYWVFNAAHELNVDIPWPVQYGRGKKPKK